MTRGPLAFFALLTLVHATPSLSWAAKVVISCGSVGKEFEVCRSGAERWAQDSGNQVEILASPANSSERLSQLQLLLSAKSPDIDIFLIDTTWPGLLADFFVDLNTNSEIRSAARAHFEAFIQNNTVGGRLVALPWFIDAGVLFYRRDLLEKYAEKPPNTWRELTRIAEKVQLAERARGNSRFWGYVFQGRAYEGLTCNGLEWIKSWGGGQIVEPSGQITIDNPASKRALELAASWIGNITPRGVLNYMEEESRGVFQSGNAAFLRNWPYVWKLANAQDSPVRGKIGILKLPQGDAPGGSHASTLGGWSLAVSKYSRHPKEATQLVAFLSSPAEQKRRTLLLGQNPTIRVLYKDRDLLAENPELPNFLTIFQDAVARPSGVTGPKYNRVSSEIWEMLHRVLSDEETSIDHAVESLSQRLLFLSRGGKW